MTVTLRNKSKWPKGRYDLRPGYGQKIEEIPSAGFYMRRADDVTLRNCKTRFADALEEFGQALYAEDCANLERKDLKNYNRSPSGKPGGENACIGKKWML